MELDTPPLLFSLKSVKTSKKYSFPFIYVKFILLLVKQTYNYGSF